MLSKKKPQDKVALEYLVGLDTASAQPAPAGVRPFIQKPITAADTYTVKPMVKGTILTADFEVGDTVSKGDVLYTIDSSDVASSVEKAQLSLEQAQSSYDDAVDAQYIRSSVRGTVSSLKVKAGDVVSAGQEVAVVRDDSTLLLTLDFPAADAITYFVGQSVDVTIDGTFETTTGTIQSISGADSLSSGNLAVRSVVIAVQNPGTLNTTMSGTASINGVSAMSSAHFTCQYEQTITATASGTIIAKDVKVGDTVGSSSSTTETMCVINDLSYLEMTLDVDELDILDIAVGQKAEITADAIDDCTLRASSPASPPPAPPPPTLSPSASTTPAASCPA